MSDETVFTCPFCKRWTGDFGVHFAEHLLKEHRLHQNPRFDVGVGRESVWCGLCERWVGCHKGRTSDGLYMHFQTCGGWQAHWLEWKLHLLESKS